MKNIIKLLVPEMPKVEQILPYWQQIDENRWYTNFGPLVTELEGRLSRSFSREPAQVHVVSMANGTCALQIALEALKLRKGGRVLVPGLTFVATATAIIRAGLTPLISDVNLDNWLLTPAIARNVLAETPYDAVMPVATYGCPQDVAGWDLFSAETGIPVVVDAAGAWGNQQIGLTTKVAFSLHATKSLGGGEGGFVASRHHAYAQSMRALSNFGIDAHSGGLVFEAGENGKMSEYHAAVALAALDNWPSVSETRRSLHQRYAAQLLKKIPSLKLQVKPMDGLYSLMLVLLPPGFRGVDIQLRLLGKDIETRRWYCPPLHSHPAFQACTAGPLPMVELLAERLLGLPFHLSLTDANIQRVIDCLAELLAAQPAAQ
ncbi:MULTISPECIES: DegT/DnrJ/EryC1/StrS family aminotransferase [unclassified Pseudomonas]|uniref:DegT/DnrJ/EryC1/StrS family aminotransferase n=1 Tax=unclassified Pseudomonas TaxID=196821 RepID=UPI0020056B87|nr:MULTISPECIES: DegT/DnrJ/EryC1/StrS family aminotransferase [unclassified Pseudomonas]MCK6187520.1 DegT/DnrJ/EryC1/StrS family aminotransferase [Pseudomonas sp. EYE_354]MDT9633990.1 DegT/DnrJ/EryC1/StrS aminotransferase [Pseudomonas sp. JV449]